MFRPLPGGVLPRLWASSALSSAATWVMQIGLFVQVLGHSGIATLAVVELLGTTPSVVVMPFAGVLADRVDARRLAVLSMVIQAAALIGMAVVLDVWRWPLLGMLYAIQGLANTVWPPARQRWLYVVVAPERRVLANGAIGSVGGVTTILGAGVGGVLSAWSPLAALWCAAVLQLLAVVPLLRRAGEPVAVVAGRGDAGASGNTGIRSDFVAGLRCVRSLPLPRSIIWVGIAWGCIGGAYSVLLAGHVTTDLGGGGPLLGLFYVLDGVAVIVGGIGAARVPPGRHLLVYTLAYLVQGGAWILVFATSSIGVSGGALVVMRLASGVVIALDTTLLLATVPAELRGRVTSLHMTTYAAMARVSLALFGALLTISDPRLLGIGAGVSSLLIGLVWAGMLRGRTPGGE
ncbi:MFS transporter [Pseudonocardia spinosispora]|uniref:MFS transporter n=1 Tax=Pseudonocardia spinosispora TaxID=103441 RepID=UPI00048DEF39|nr:MFS transporter [Pseudonocardia spinosispora]